MNIEQLETGFAREGELVAGSIVAVDGGFTCLPEGARHIVQQGVGGLFIPCRAGRHYLDGQLENGVYVGLSLVSSGSIA